MNIEQVRVFALTLPAVTEDMPYGPDWLVMRIAGKIFLHIRLNTAEPIIAIKLNPDEGASLREHYDGIRPAYHMNKLHWNDLHIDTLDSPLIESLIIKSYQAVAAKLPKKTREALPPLDTDTTHR